MRILGIELGSWSVKAVELESRFRKLEVVDFHEIQLPIQIQNPTEVYREAVQKLMARLPNHPEKLVTSLPATVTALRFLNLPIKQRKVVEKTYRFEMEDTVPFKLEDSIVEHHIWKVPTGSLVFASLSPKKHIANYLDWLKTIGLDPDWLTFEGMGLINLYLSNVEGSKEPLPDESILLIDLGHAHTHCSIFNQDRLELFRSLSWGGFSITQSISTHLSITLSEAEKLKQLNLDLSLVNPDNKKQEELFLAASQTLSSFVAELSHLMISYKNSFRKEIKKILLAGGGASTRGIASFLNQALGIPVALYENTPDIKVRNPKSVSLMSRFAEPLGRSIVFTRTSSLLFNFRKQELGKQSSLNELRDFLQNPNILKLAQYLGVLLLILFAHSFFADMLGKKESEKATEELRSVFQDVFRTVPVKLKNSLTDSPEDLQKFVDQKKKELEQKIKMLGKNRTPMLSMILTLSNSFPADIKVDVNTLQIDDRNFLIQGVVYQGDLQAVLEKLKVNQSFKNVDLQKEGQRFTFKGEVVGR